ncbi:MAG: hypothetical protein IJM59_00650 [Proteobacteria bacterium]|nr:hypothetical protein [Pseudomonadota bacterium]
MKWYSSIVTAIVLCLCSAVFAQDVQTALNNGDLAEAQKLLGTMSTDANEESAVAGLCGQAQIALAKGDYMVAMARLEETTPKLAALKKKSGWHVVVPWLKADIAFLQKDTITCEHEISAAREALAAGAKVNHGWNGAIEYLTSQCEKDNSHARDAAEAAILAFQKAQMHHEKGLASLRLAELEWERGKQRRAFREYDAAIQAFRNSDSESERRLLAETMMTSAERMISAGETKSARSRLESAKAVIEQLNSPADLDERFNNINNTLPE